MFLILHGETEWNRERRFQGQLDSPLTELGEEQSLAMARMLRAHRPADPHGYRIVSSTLGRAVATARIVAGHLGIDEDGIVFDDRLMEIDEGDCQGLTRREAFQPAAKLSPARSRPVAPPPTGRSQDDARLPDAPGDYVLQR